MIYIDKFIPPDSSELGKLLMIPDSEWDRYDNPFEQKYVLRSKSYLSAVLLSWLPQARRLLGTKDLLVDKTRYYDAVFKYVEGDYLGLHLDAGINPRNGLRKAATVLWYLSTSDLEGGDLYFNDGVRVKCSYGTIVIFDNSDIAWHGNLSVTQGTRFVVTASFMSENHGMHTNFREHAYFHADTPELKELRDLRASDKAHEAYRIKPRVAV